MTTDVTAPAGWTVPPYASDRPHGLPDDEPLTTGWVNAALSKLCAVGLPTICDWLMEPGCGDRLELPEVDAMIRDVLDLDGTDLGYGLPEVERCRVRDRTRFELLALWTTDPRYADTDPEDPR